MMKKADPLIFLFFIAVLIGASMTNCAKVVNPTGGPKDTIPPVPVEAEPPNYSINFEAKKIEIMFNEFIQLKDVKQQFISSPPFEEDPEIKEKGDEIEIELEGKLRDSTTYTLNFGNSIVDFHEGNPLRNYRYVFSTGDQLDSLTMYGTVIDALTLEPKENTLVMLYSERKDSIPFLELPEYVSRTNENGQFHIGNIRLDTFKIFALEDANNNYLYDSPDEKIAFSDSLVVFEKERIEKHDTVFEDTLTAELRAENLIDTITRIQDGKVFQDTIRLSSSDSLLIDTVFYKSYMGYKPVTANLRLFDEENRPQYLKTTLRKDKRKISFVFNRPVIDSIEMKLIDSTEHKGDIYLAEDNEEEDTLTYWLKDSSLYNRELLTYWVEYKRRDSLNQYYWQRDTVKFRYTFKEEDKKETIDTLSLHTNIEEGKKMDLGKKISLSSEYPIHSFDSARICLWEVEDTVYFEKTVDFKKKPGSLYSLATNFKWKPATSYRFLVLPQTVHTIYNFYQDSLERNFSTRPEDYYGEIKLLIKNYEGDLIIQLLDEEKKVVKEKWAASKPKHNLMLNYLNPGKYRIRLIEDVNGNKKWDTGDYLQHKQPEKVLYYPEKIDVRANWEMDLEWDIQKTKIFKPQK